ncbi:Failed axon connections-like [Exaiptasia diaphana]|nr:Failed axon connections-like [Exaiptasia diaphana]
MSSKGKMPWIEYNGQDIADSNFCIEFLIKENGPGFGIDVDSHLSDEQKAIARAVLVMLEENTFRTWSYFLFLGEGNEIPKKVFLENFSFPLRYLLFRFGFQRNARRNLHGHGIGRHFPKEVYGIAEKDLRAVSTILGEKKFLFGDKACLADAYLFALVSNFIFVKPVSPQGKVILTQLKNLEAHTNRMKEAYYPDWDEVALG